MSTYNEDLVYAALSDPSFDKTNSVEIGDLHGEEPKRVEQDIKDLRWARAKAFFTK